MRGFNRRPMGRGQRLYEQKMSDEWVAEMTEITEDALYYFRKKTKIQLDSPLQPHPFNPVIRGREKEISFSAKITREIDTPLMSLIFKEMTFYVEAYDLGDGDYVFNFSVSYRHPNGGSNGRDLGKVFYEGGKFIVRLNG